MLRQKEKAREVEDRTHRRAWCLGSRASHFAMHRKAACRISATWFLLDTVVPKSINTLLFHISFNACRGFPSEHFDEDLVNLLF
jgi:hypothetical protein